MNPLIYCIIAYYLFVYEWNYWVNLSWIESFIVVMIDEKSNQGNLAELEDPKIFVICYKQ
jgi:hypothetical protein